MTWLSKAVADLAPSIIRNMSGMKTASSVDLSLGQPALAPDAEVLDRAYARLRSGPSGYTATAGMPELRARIAAHHGLPDRSAAENTIVTVGSEQAVFLSLLSTVNAGDEMLIPQPGYPAYAGIAKLLGATAVGYRLRRETGLVARAEEIERRLTDRTRVLILNGPSNPFGSVDERTELEAIARLVEARGLIVISDEIYRDLDFTADGIPSITTMTDRAILVSGLSKSCAMTGLRLGYLVASTALIPKATLAHQLVVTCAPTLSQLAAIEVFDAPEKLRAQLPFYREARAVVREAVPNLGVPVHLGEGAFYAILDVERLCDGDPMQLAVQLVEEEDVVLVPGNAFGEGGDWFWRLSYASGADAVREGLSRIARFVARRASSDS